eukprot:EG_transcript_26537
MDGPPQPLKDSTNLPRDVSSTTSGGFWNSAQAPKLLSQLAAREDENKKLRGELKRRKTEGRTVFEMEGEASRLRKELETLQATTAHQLELKDRETDRLQATIRELQERMQADVAEFQFQVSANKTRQVAFTATLREQQERLAAREAEAARLRGAVGERDALVRELQGRLEETEERLRGLKAELQASASQVAAAETAHSAGQQLAEQLQLAEAEWRRGAERAQAEAAAAAQTAEQLQQRLAEA